MDSTVDSIGTRLGLDWDSTVGESLGCVARNNKWMHRMMFCACAKLQVDECATIHGCVWVLLIPVKKKCMQVLCESCMHRLMHVCRPSGMPRVIGCTTWGSTRVVIPGTQHLSHMWLCPAPNARVVIPGTQHLSQGTVDGQYYAPLWRV